MAAQLAQQLDGEPVEPQGEPQRPDACRVVVRETNGGAAGYARCERHGTHVAFAFGKSFVRGLYAHTTCVDGRPDDQEGARA